MGIEEIKKDDTLEIKGKKYQVIEAWDIGFDKLPSGKERWYNVYELIEIVGGKITATHTLIYYKDGKNTFLWDRIKDKKEKIKKEDVKILS